MALSVNQTGKEVMTDIRPCDVTSVDAIYLDCSLPDYFNGSTAEEVLAVPVAHDTTYADALESLTSEFHATSGYFDEVAGSGGMVEDALKKLFCEVSDMGAVADFVSGIDKTDDEDAPSVYLYIALNAVSDL